LTELERRLDTPFSFDVSDNCISQDLGVQASHVCGFDFILDLLNDGKYHTFEDIFSRQTMLNETQLEGVLIFLSKFGFVKRLRHSWTTRTWKVVLQPEVVNFLRELKELEACK